MNIKMATCIRNVEVPPHARAWSSILQILHHTLEVKAFCLFVKVSVLAHIETDAGENLVVVSPGWITDVDWCRSVLLQKLSQNS